MKSEEDITAALPTTVESCSDSKDRQDPFGKLTVRTSSIFSGHNKEIAPRFLLVAAIKVNSRVWDKARLQFLTSGDERRDDICRSRDPANVRGDRDVGVRPQP